MTLKPGVVISTGTLSGEGESRGIFLKPRDFLKLEIKQIEVLKNPVLPESSRPGSRPYGRVDCR